MLIRPQKGISLCKASSIRLNVSLYATEKVERRRGWEMVLIFSWAKYSFGIKVWCSMFTVAVFDMKDDLSPNRIVRKQSLEIKASGNWCRSVRKRTQVWVKGCWIGSSIALWRKINKNLIQTEVLSKSHYSEIVSFLAKSGRLFLQLTFCKKRLSLRPGNVLTRRRKIPRERVLFVSSCWYDDDI